MNLRVWAENLECEGSTDDHLQSKEEPCTLDGDGTPGKSPVLGTLDVGINVVVEDIVDGHDLIEGG